MTPQILTYILLVVSAGMLIMQYLTYTKNKRNGYATNIRIFQTIAYLIVFVIALYAVITGQTYDDILQMF